MKLKKYENWKQKHPLKVNIDHTLEVKQLASSNYEATGHSRTVIQTHISSFLEKQIIQHVKQFKSKPII